jgi:hypothetical protein
MSLSNKAHRHSPHAQEIAEPERSIITLMGDAHRQEGLLNLQTTADARVMHEKRSTGRAVI